MAGGGGSRFWPISRNNRPKQFLNVAGTDKTIFQFTFERFAKFIPLENIIVITAARFKDLITEQAPALLPENLLLEPYSRNTAPCITYATYTLLKRNPEATVVVSPADHLIFDEDVFKETIASALDYAEKNEVLMTLGIKPTRPDTNFGYIQATGGKNSCSDGKPVKVKTFTEKPDISLAKIFINSGEFFWNSGIFVWKAESIKEELERYLPEVTRLFAGWENAIGSPFEEKFIEHAYTDCINISIDYGIMEKTEKAWLYPARFGWFDFSSWDSLYAIYPEKDDSGNAVKSGKVLLEGCRDNLFVSESPKKLLAVKGLNDYMVIDTQDVLLICPRDEKKFKDFIAGIAMPEYEEYR